LYLNLALILCCAVVAFVNTTLNKTESSQHQLVQCEQSIVSEFRRRRQGGATDTSNMADTLNIELSRLGLDIEIIELRERGSVRSTLIIIIIMIIIIIIITMLYCYMTPC